MPGARWAGGHILFPLPGRGVGGGPGSGSPSPRPLAQPHPGPDPQTWAPAGRRGPSLTQIRSNTLSFSTEQNSPSLDFRFLGWERVS